MKILMLSVVMLSVVMLSVVMLSVVAPAYVNVCLLPYLRLIELIYWGE